jgi:putative nucleotidyltransferase with HDIG domain
MKDKPPSRSVGGKKKSQPTRKLSFPLRVRAQIWLAMDRLLGSDVGWSLALVVVALALLGNQRCGTTIEPIALGEIAPYDIVAPEELLVVDAALTQERRELRRSAVADVYEHNAERGNQLVSEMALVFEQGRQRLSENAELGEGVPAAALAPLARLRFSSDLQQSLSEALSWSMRGLVVGNKAVLERAEAIALIHLPVRREERLTDYGAIVDVSAAREDIRREVAGRLDLRAADEQALAEFAASFVDANVAFDSDQTQQRQREAVDNVPPVTVRLPRGHVLARKGERVSSATLERIDSARAAAHGGLGWHGWASILLVLSLLAFFLYRYGGYHQRNYRKHKHLHALLVLMLLLMMTMTRAIQWVAREAIENLSEPFNQLDAYTYLIPLGAGAIIIALLANGRIATVYTAFASLLFGALNGYDFYVTAWAMLVQLSGVYAISAYRARTVLLRAGFVVGSAGAILALAVEALRGEVDSPAQSLYGAGLAFVGGAVGVGLLISFLLPLLERMFHVLTDVRLLELSNVDNPLLQQLAVKAPGSYNHSLVVGTLAEEGARAIGANSLFCRVAAVYHDIGKINHPEYYVENQRGRNPHDRLTPSMSALVIASHVKDGIKLASEAGLPEQIIDIIPQHHGTKLMGYFYEKAKSMADPALGPVKEEDFRYPGPKPQTREAAIFMLADSVEAAARTIDEPTSNRLKEMISKITNSIVLDRQLDNCDLTFADLERIQQAFHRLLVGMYHHRVDYPGFDFGNRPKTDAKTDAKTEQKTDTKIESTDGVSG